MKKFLVLISIAILLSSCMLPLGVDMMRDPEMEFASLDECGNWIADNIRYDASGEYEWQSPYQTMQRRSGMCVDFSSLLIWYAIEKFGADKNTTYIQKVVTKKGVKHAICVINGVMIEPQSYTVVRASMYKEILDRISYEEMCNIIYFNYGNRSVK